MGGSQSTGARCDSDGEGGGEGILEPGGMGGGGVPAVSCDTVGVSLALYPRQGQARSGRKGQVSQPGLGWAGQLCLSDNNARHLTSVTRE